MRITGINKISQLADAAVSQTVKIACMGRHKILKAINIGGYNSEFSPDASSSNNIMGHVGCHEMLYHPGTPVKHTFAVNI